MTEEQIARREQELREQCPHMFSHPECGLGEICLDIQLIDIAVVNINIYRSLGMPSVRPGEPALKSFQGYEKMTFRPIIAKLVEYILTEEAHGQKNSQPAA